MFRRYSLFAPRKLYIVCALSPTTNTCLPLAACVSIQLSWHAERSCASSTRIANARGTMAQSTCACFTTPAYVQKPHSDLPVVKSTRIDRQSRDAVEQ